MDLANRIQMLRKKMNLSQEELAEKCNVSRQSVTKWEASESIPTIDKLILLADIFEISLDELTGRSQINPHNRLLKLIKDFIVDGIPTNAEDEVSAIITRYLLFAQNVNLDASDTLKGLEDIFLHNVEKEMNWYAYHTSKNTEYR